MIKNVISTLLAILMIGSMLTPITFAVTGSSNEEENETGGSDDNKIEVKEEFEMNGIKYKNEFELVFENGMWRKKVRIEGPGGRVEFKTIKSVDDVRPTDELNTGDDFDDGVVIDEGKRCGDFEDVSVEDKLCKYLHKAKEHSVVSANARFFLGAPVSRAQFAAMVVRALQLEADITNEETFSDVDTANTFYNAILTLKALDIVEGVEVDDGVRFFPAWPITRGQAIKILVNALEASGSFEFEDSEFDLKMKFKDEKIDEDSFAPFIKKLYASESKMPEVIVRGYSDGYIRSGRLISRFEAIVMITRAMWAAGIINAIEEPILSPTPTVSPTASTVKEVITQIEDMEFSVDEFEAKAGQKVKVKVYNSSDMIHDFVIDELDVDSGEIEPNSYKIVEFTIPEDAEEGTKYEFYCSIGDHRALGLEGKIEVSD